MHQRKEFQKQKMPRISVRHSSGRSGKSPNFFNVGLTAIRSFNSPIYFPIVRSFLHELKAILLGPGA